MRLEQYLKYFSVSFDVCFKDLFLNIKFMHRIQEQQAISRFTFKPQQSTVLWVDFGERAVKELPVQLMKKN